MKEIRDWFNKINKANRTRKRQMSKANRIRRSLLILTGSAHYQNDDGAIVNQERYKPDNEKKNKMGEIRTAKIESEFKKVRCA